MTEIELFLLTGVFFLLLVQILIGASLLKFYRLMGTINILPEFSLEEAIGGGTARTVPGRSPASGTVPEQHEGSFADEIPTPPHVETITGRENIRDSLEALCNKYSMESFTIAAKDGLVIASSIDTAEGEAAQYSYLYTSGISPHDPMVRLFGVEYNGEELVGIARAVREIPDAWVPSIAREANDILMWWL
jgi:hypothetical protein